MLFVSVTLSGCMCTTVDCTAPPVGCLGEKHEEIDSCSTGYSPMTVFICLLHLYIYQNIYQLPEFAHSSYLKAYFTQKGKFGHP